MAAMTTMMVATMTAAIATDILRRGRLAAAPHIADTPECTRNGKTGNMNRRALPALLLVALVSGGAARADEPIDRILRELRQLGYTEVTVERTLLRRTRILAHSEEAEREIVVNPHTGEILRDLLIPVSKSGSTGKNDDFPDGSSSHGSGDDGDDDDGSGGGDDGGGDDGGGDDGGDDGDD